VTFIVGLCIYGIGTIIFWPSVVTKSYGGFMLSNFVVGFGISVLETGGNAFIVLCGPSQYGETRALLAQGVQSVGAVVSEVLARKALFRGIAGDTENESTRLINVQWTYLAITLVCVGLALFFYYMPLPETNDSELEEASLHREVRPQTKSFFGWELRTWSLVLAVFAQYMYNAAQETCGIYFQSLLLSVVPGSPTSGDQALLVASDESEFEHPPELTLATTDYLIIAHAAFAVSRFLTGYFTYLAATRPRMPQPRTILTVSAAMSTACALAIAVVPRTNDPNLAAIPLILFYFSQGPIWPLIYGIGLRGQGRRTKRAAAFITMGGAGPAATPFIMYGIVTTGHSIQDAFFVIFALQLLVLAYPIFLDSVADARKLVDPRAAMAYLNGQFSLPTTRPHLDNDKSADAGAHDLGINNNGLRTPEPTAFGAVSGDPLRPGSRSGPGRRDRLVRKATVMGTKLGVVRARTVA
jgi:fucose permease